MRVHARLYVCVRVRAHVHLCVCAHVCRLRLTIHHLLVVWLMAALLALILWWGITLDLQSNNRAYTIHTDQRWLMVSLRLVGCPTNNTSCVEVYIGNEWGSICDDGWSSEDTKVVCHPLGYPASRGICRNFEKGFPLQLIYQSSLYFLTALLEYLNLFTKIIIQNNAISVAIM